MKTITNKSHTKTIKSVISTLDSYIKENEKYKNAYFWNSPSSSSARRNMEFENKLDFKILGDNITIETSLAVTCNNVYYSKHYSLNGENKDLRLIKKTIKKLESIINSRSKQWRI